MQTSPAEAVPGLLALGSEVRRLSGDGSCAMAALAHRLAIERFEEKVTRVAALAEGRRMPMAGDRPDGLAPATALAAGASSGRRADARRLAESCPRRSAPGCTRTSRLPATPLPAALAVSFSSVRGSLDALRLDRIRRGARPPLRRPHRRFRQERSGGAGPRLAGAGAPRPSGLRLEAAHEAARRP